MTYAKAGKRSSIAVGDDKKAGAGIRILSKMLASNAALLMRHCESESFAGDSQRDAFEKAPT